MREVRLQRIERVIADVQFERALAYAHTQPQESFAQALLSQLGNPHERTVALDLTALTVAELWLLARSGDATLPDISTMTAGQLREYVMQEQD